MRNFRQIVLWPLQILCEGGAPRGEGYDAFVTTLAPNVWRLVEDEFGNPDIAFQERHYREFVAFLPPVQRFLYGDAAGRSGKLGPNDAPLRVFRRDDVARMRITLTPGAIPVECEVAHVDLYFFYDVDAVILVFEFCADALPLETVQIGTTATGFLGMNLIAAADAPFEVKASYFLLAMAICGVVTFLTVTVSQRLIGFFDWLTGEKDQG